MLQAGEEGPDAALAERLERAYYGLTEQTHRHFARRGKGWLLTGVAGLDAPTMNRAVVESDELADLDAMLEEANRYFGERDLSWSALLASFRPCARWHGELIRRGFQPTSSLDVLVRPPGEPPAVDLADGASVRVVGRDEVGVFTDLLMDVFRMPRRFYPALLDMTDAWRRAGATLYFAEAEGAPAATALLARTDGVAGIYNVGTLRHHRRLGLARALMERLLDDARDADVVTLQVAPEGFVERFYLDMGFQPCYHWRFYSPRSRLALFR